MNTPHAGCRPLPHRLLLAGAIGLAMVVPAQADSVTDWNALPAAPRCCRGSAGRSNRPA